MREVTLGFTMNKFKLAKRKIELQYLQIKYVSKGKNLKRTEEQREVMKYLLLNPLKLFRESRLPKSHKHSKHLNILTANSKKDKLYNLTKSMLKK